MNHVALQLDDHQTLAAKDRLLQALQPGIKEIQERTTDLRQKWDSARHDHGEKLASLFNALNASMDGTCDLNWNFEASLVCTIIVIAFTYKYIRGHFVQSNSWQRMLKRICFIVISCCLLALTKSTYKKYKIRTEPLFGQIVILYNVSDELGKAYTVYKDMRERAT